MELVLEESKEKSGKFSKYTLIVDPAILGNFVIRVAPSGQCELTKMEDNPTKKSKSTRFEGSYKNVGECLQKIAFHKLVDKHKVTTVSMFFEEFRKIDKELRSLLLAVKPETQSIIDVERLVGLLKNKIILQDKKINEIDVLNQKVAAQAKENALMRNQLNTLYSKLNS